MATGFMHFSLRRRVADCSRRSVLLTVLTVLALAPAPAVAQATLVGVVPGKAAILVIDGGEPKTVRIGQRHLGHAVLSVEREAAVVEFEGRRSTLKLGQHVVTAQAVPSSRARAVLASDPRGHFMADGLINGIPLRLLVDTGATMIAIPATQARQMGIDLSKARRGMTQTANGPAPVYRVRLDSIKVGGIELYGVDAIVMEGDGLNVALLGMSFLNRVEMRRDGDTMTLVQRY